jgi:hypothetical protein
MRELCPMRVEKEDFVLVELEEARCLEIVDPSLSSKSPCDPRASAPVTRKRPPSHELGDHFPLRPYFVGIDVTAELRMDDHSGRFLLSWPFAEEN